MLFGKASFTNEEALNKKKIPGPSRLDEPGIPREIKNVLAGAERHAGAGSPFQSFAVPGFSPDCKPNSAAACANATARAARRAGMSPHVSPDWSKTHPSDSVSPFEGWCKRS